jgi:nucleoid-associated protein YejK
MTLTIDQLVRLSASGGGMTINVKGKTVDQLVRIAAAGGEHKPQLIITGAETLTIDQLVRISAGNGRVFFNFVE